jgi:hypothetical protein
VPEDGQPSPARVAQNGGAAAETEQRVPSEPPTETAAQP